MLSQDLQVINNANNCKTVDAGIKVDTRCGDLNMSFTFDRKSYTDADWSEIEEAAADRMNMLEHHAALLKMFAQDKK